MKTLLLVILLPLFCSANANTIEKNEFFYVDAGEYTGPLFFAEHGTNMARVSSEGLYTAEPNDDVTSEDSWSVIEGRLAHGLGFAGITCSDCLYMKSPTGTWWAVGQRNGKQKEHWKGRVGYNLDGYKIIAPKILNVFVFAIDPTRGQLKTTWKK